LVLDLIRQKHDAIGENLRVYQLQGRTIAIDKQADAFAQDNRMHQHLNLIDQARVKQRMNECRAADNRDHAAGLLLQLADFLDYVGLDLRRVIPIGFLQRCRNDVLGRTVQLVSNPEFMVRQVGQYPANISYVTLPSKKASASRIWRSVIAPSSSV
jgi:hypothetical protein